MTDPSLHARCCESRTYFWRRAMYCCTKGISIIETFQMKGMTLQLERPCLHWTGILTRPGRRLGLGERPSSAPLAMLRLVAIRALLDTAHLLFRHHLLTQNTSRLKFELPRKEEDRIIVASCECHERSN